MRFRCIAIRVFAAAVLAVAFCSLAGTASPQPSSASEALAPFARLIGGEWTMGNSKHSLEWGLDGKSIVAHTWITQPDGTAVLVAQAIWFWHPKERVIRGYSVAEGMPFELMEMTTRFEGNTVINRLRAFTADGSAMENFETWELTSDNEYVWTLYKGTDLDSPVWMRGTFTRK